MKLLAALLGFLAFILAGFSWKCVVCYSIFAVVSWGLTFIFLSNKCELDFEVIFKVFEWIGYGAPRFLENKILPSPENTTNGQETLYRIPEPISKRVDILIENVSRDFIASWYHEVAEEDVFIDESKAALQKLSQEIHQRMTNLDSHYLSQQVIMIFHAHLERFNKAVRVLKDKDPTLKLSLTSSQLLHQTYESQIPTKHIALKNPSSELNYLRTVIDSLLAALLPPNIFSCDMGRFILREILAVQLVDLVNLLTDPDWVNEAIIDLLCPPKSQLSDVLTYRKPVNQTIDQANKKIVGSIGNSIGINSTLPASFNIGPERAGRELSFGNHVSFVEGQVRSGPAERDIDKDLVINDNTIAKRDKETSLEHNNEQLLINSCNSFRNENIKTHSDSLNQNSILLRRAEKDQEMTYSAKTSGLSSSWGFLPSFEDKTFQTQSFEAIKQQAIERERLKNSTPKFLESCCTRFETSDDMDGNPQNDCAKIRSRTASLPGALNLVANRIENKNERFINQRKRFQRSVSFPNNICSTLDHNEPLDPIDRPLRSSTIDPIPVYGSPYYNISFCSSDGSFKSFSDNGMDVEEGEEMDEGTDSDSCEILEDIAPLPIMKVAKMSVTPRESKNNNMGNNTDGRGNDHEGNIRQRKLGFVKRKEVFKDNFEGGNGIVGSTEDANFKKNRFVSYDNRYRSSGSKDSDSSDPRSPLETTSPSQRLESDPSFGDSVKKFISSFKSPVKKFGFSSGSSKSTSTSSGADSLDVNLPSSIDNASFDSDLPFYRPVLKTKTDSPSSARKLSRSQAIVDVSSDSESETWYGTPAAAVKEEIVYGVASSSSGDATDSDNRTVVKIHPSKLISIPSSETALESEGEPGRNKFTLYRIEYDIRIWPSVYKAIIEEEHQQESTEEKEKVPHKKKNIPRKRAIKRRYREFMELHNRLCNGPMAIHMKDILKPNRKYNLPFGRLDKDVVEGRRHLLQNYLVNLVSKPELRDCNELKQFLGVIGGVSFIKPSVAQIMSQSVHVPRVDKMLSRQMTKVIDSIKTALEIEGQEGTEDSKVPDAMDSTTCPWTIVRHSSLDEPTDLTDEEVLPADCFSAFLETLQLSTPHWRYHDTDTDDGYDESSDDDDDDDDNNLYLFGQRTAGDGSDTPNEPSISSAVSKDDMLNGVLGSRPPGLCIPCTLPHSASTGSLNDKGTVDFGKQWFQKYVHEETPMPQAHTAPLPSSMDKPTDSINEPQKAKFSHQLRFSKKNVERLKHAAQKAREKRIESMENIGHAKDKVKTFSKEKKVETFEHLGHVKDKVKTFTKETKIEPMEQLSYAKEKLKTFSKDTKFEPMEHLSHAKEKVKTFSKDNKFETMEHLSHAKEKVKTFSKEKKMETSEHLSHAKEKVKAFSKDTKNETMENLGQAKHRVKAFSKEKKMETTEQLSLAKDKVKAYSKEKKIESMENLNQAKEKVKEFQKKLSDSKQLIKKRCSSHPSHMGDNKEEPSIPVDTKKATVLASEITPQDTNGIDGRKDQPLVMTNADDPSHGMTELTQGMAGEELQSPLAHVIVDLVCEVLEGQDSWASNDRVQEGFLGLFGALFEWFVRGEIDDLFMDDCWGLYLENLIEVVWPDGKLIEPSGEQKSEEEKEKTRKKAVETLMEFFPDVFPLFVGSRIYKDCANNAVESLQNPVINRILIYILLELFLPEIIPELQRNIEGQETLE